MASEQQPPTQASTDASPPNVPTQQQPAFVPYAQYQQSYGQPFQPYTPQPIPQQQQQQRPEALENKKWTWTKFGLHVADIVFCICGLSITFSMIGRGETGYILLACCPVIVLALIWDIAELITRCVRKFKSGIHPGAHVALSLIIWLSTSVVGGMEATWVAVGGDSYHDCYDYSTGTYDDDDCRSGAFGGRKGHTAAVAAFTCLIFLTHFILFVGACVDTAKRNALARRPIIVAAGPPYWGPPAQGWQPMPQYFGPGQGQYSAVPQQQQPNNIPMQTRSPMEQQQPQQGNGKEVEQVSPQPTPTVTEYYTPGRA